MQIANALGHEQMSVQASPRCLEGSAAEAATEGVADRTSEMMPGAKALLLGRLAAVVTVDPVPGGTKVVGTLPALGSDAEAASSEIRVGCCCCC